MKNMLFKPMILYALLPGIIISGCVSVGHKVRSSENEIIDYSQPSKYVANGQDTQMPPEEWIAIEAMLKGKNLDECIITVYEWKGKHFNATRGGGALVGKNSVEKILSSRELTGCHDHALLIASILRSVGYPVIFVDTAGIEWARQYREGKAEGHLGHVFLEIYDGTNWVLLDSTQPIVIRDYDPQNPFIPITRPIEPVGFYTMLKGVDPADYGVNDLQDLYIHMNRFAAKLKAANIEMPEYDVEILK